MDALPSDILVHEDVDGPHLDRDWEQILTEEENARRSSMKSEDRRRLFVLGRMVLRTHLGHRLGIPPAHVPIAIHPGGRLLLGSSGDDLEISLAHSGNRAVAVSATRPIGVDLEVMKPRQESLIRYITHDEEQAILEQLGATLTDRLYVVWTLKEAVLKGIGTGLRTGPRKLRIQPGDDPGHALVLDMEGRTWHARYRIDDGYAMAVAWL